jgi:CelD/BcsL family acetyltransferase involved in cellulose biosynthesis
MRMQLRLLNPATEFGEVERIWRHLTAAGAPSYFLSWGWMETWLRRMPEQVLPRLAVFENGGEPVMAGLLGHAKVTRRKIFRSTAYLLNETGRRPYDQVFVEYNSFVGRPDLPVRLEEIVNLLPGKWDELCLSGVDPERLPGSCMEQKAGKLRLYVVNRMPSPYVDLEAVAAKKGDYLSLLSSNTRSQIRRSTKLYQQRGAVTLAEAGDLDTALAYYAEMKDLHEKAWRAKGDSGAFANAWFDGFHRALIEARFGAGEIQLLRVACGDEPIGVIYNFVLDGRVYYYQAGFRFEEDNKLKPGYTGHAEAILHNYRAGNKRYEFLAGYEDYKVRLSTGHGVLVWARLQKPRLGFAIENAARHAAIWAVEKYEERKGRKSGRKLAAEVLNSEPLHS